MANRALYSTAYKTINAIHPFSLVPVLELDHLVGDPAQTYKVRTVTTVPQSNGLLSMLVGCGLHLLGKYLRMIVSGKTWSAWGASFFSTPG